MTYDKTSDTHTRCNSPRGVRLVSLLAVSVLLFGFQQAARAESLTTGSALEGSETATSGVQPEISLTPSTTRPYTGCPPATTKAECNLVIDPPPIKTAEGYESPSTGELLPGSGVEGGLDPENIREAYNIPVSGGSTETVGIVDAFYDEHAKDDLKEYRSHYKLGECTEANGCLRIVNEKGEQVKKGTEPPEEPKGSTWGAEKALDLEMVSLACQECKMLLVEASGEGPAELAASVKEAFELQATSVADSYGFYEYNPSRCPEEKECTEYSSTYDHPGLPVIASAGDSGYDDWEKELEGKQDHGTNWPASSPYVMAVGGTELQSNESVKRHWTETVWKKTGSGCAGTYDPKAAWQTDGGCSNRTGNDVAAVAEDVSIYSTPTKGGWGDVGGTSASAPL